MDALLTQKSTVDSNKLYTDLGWSQRRSGICVQVIFLPWRFISQCAKNGKNCVIIMCAYELILTIYLKCFLKNLNKITFGFMTSNVSKCVQTFSASVMTYLQLKGLVLQCHCTALNAVKRSQMKPFGFMASYVSKCAQLFSDSVMNCSQKQLLFFSIKCCQKQLIKQFGFMASNVSKK